MLSRVFCCFNSGCYWRTFGKLLSSVNRWSMPCGGLASRSRHAWLSLYCNSRHWIPSSLYSSCNKRIINTNPGLPPINNYSPFHVSETQTTPDVWYMFWLLSIKLTTTLQPKHQMSGAVWVAQSWNSETFKIYTKTFVYLFEFEDKLVKKEMKAFVCIINAKLLKAVHLEIL
jgi:hypothetical protein